MLTAIKALLHTEVPEIDKHITKANGIVFSEVGDGLIARLLQAEQPP